VEIRKSYLEFNLDVEEFYSGSHRNEPLLHTRYLIAVPLPKFIQIPLEYKCQAAVLLPSVPSAIKLVKAGCS